MIDTWLKFVCSTQSQAKQAVNYSHKNVLFNMVYSVLLCLVTVTSLQPRQHELVFYYLSLIHI